MENLHSRSQKGSAVTGLKRSFGSNFPSALFEKCLKRASLAASEERKSQAFSAAKADESSRSERCHQEAELVEFLLQISTLSLIFPLSVVSHNRL